MRPRRSTSATSPRRAAPSSDAARARSASAPSSASISHRAPALEPHPQAPDRRAALQHERLRRGHVPLRPRRIRRRVDLLGRHVRGEDDPVDGGRVAAVPGGGGEEADGQVGARAVEPQRVEPALVQQPRHAVELLEPLSATPRPGRARRAASRGRPPPRASRAPPPARARGARAPPSTPPGPGDPVQFVVLSSITRKYSGMNGNGSRAASVGSRSATTPVGPVGRECDPRAAELPELEHARAVPVGDEVDRVRVAVLDPCAPHPRVEPVRVDELRPAPVRGGRDLVHERALLEVGAHLDDLARLHVRAEADDQVGVPRENGRVDARRRRRGYAHSTP